MKKQIAFVTILVLAFATPLVSAAEPNVNVRTGSDQVCPTGSAQYAVDITNPGNAADTYTVGTNVDWSTVAGSPVEVGPGETETVYLWLQPPADMNPGTYGFRTIVESSNTGTSVESQSSIEVLSCRAVELTVDEPDQQVCRGETATYNVNVGNTGEAEETFELTANAGALSDDSVTLGPGESTTVTLSAYSDEVAEDTIQVNAESTESFASDTTEVRFAAEQCRDVDLFISPDERQVCEQEPSNFSITVQNAGSVTDQYSLNTNVQGANVPDLELDSGESQTFSVTVRDDPGEHNVVAEVTSQSLSNLVRTREASFNVENCYDLLLESQGNNTVQLDQENRTLMEFGLINTGTQTNSYQLSFDGPEWADVRPVESTLDPGERTPAYLYVAPDFFSQEGTYTSVLTVTDESGNVQREVATDIVVGDGEVRTETEGQDRTGLTGQLISQTSGLAAIILVLAALFLGGYWLFRNRWEDEPLDPDTGTAVEDSDTGSQGPTQEEVRDQVAGGQIAEEQQRDYYKAANDFLDQNATTVRKALREDNLSTRFLEVLLEEEQQNKNRNTVTNEIQRQLDRKAENGQ